MAYNTISRFKSDLGRKVSNLSKIPGSVDNLIEEAANNVLAQIKPEILQQTATITNDGSDIYTFTLPTDFDSVIDIASSADDGTILGEFVYVSPQEFNRNHECNTFTLGVGTLKVATPTAYTTLSLSYYSNAIFKDSNGDMNNTVSSDGDDIVLDQDAYIILLYEAAYLATPEVQGQNGVFNLNFYKDALNDKVGKYQAKHQDVTLPKSETYYEI